MFVPDGLICAVFLEASVSFWETLEADVMPLLVSLVTVGFWLLLQLVVLLCGRSVLGTCLLHSALVCVELTLEACRSVFTLIGSSRTSGVL